MVPLPLCAVNKLRSNSLKMNGKMFPDVVRVNRCGVYLIARYLIRLPDGGHDCSTPFEQKEIMKGRQEICHRNDIIILISKTATRGTENPHERYS